MTHLDLTPLGEVLGTELTVGLLSERLGRVVASAEWPALGVVHMTCADEAQQQIIDRVQRHLVEPHATPMASGERNAFRLINLGGHYEMGALDIAENHWAGAHDASRGPKLMVVRADAHVGVDHGPDGEPIYGRFLRFSNASVACGALHSVLKGVAIRGAEGFVDQQVRARRILERFDEHTQLLAAAVCRAELTARDCLADISHFEPVSPTVWLIVATVTLNHPDTHASVLTSVHLADETGLVSGSGLGVDVDRYELIQHGDHVQIRAD